jgi:uncharacterized protein (TIGR04255 family)
VIRPDLPEFAAPPLTEVVLGIQFAPEPRYSQILVKEVWDLFRERYPEVQEQPPLEPIFETFGLPEPQKVGFEVVGAKHDRFWFISPDGHELIQFQPDRLLHNWRKMLAPTVETYPRFEVMLPRFQEEIGVLDKYFRALGGSPIVPNQCEVTYINFIALPADGPCEIDKWLKFLNFDGPSPDDVNLVMRHTITDASDRIGRMYVEARVGTKPDQSRVLQLNLVVRGVPLQPTVDGALDFLRLGRNLIAKKFAEITTDSAHSVWERIR